MPGDSYTLREVAELLGVSKRTLQRRIKDGAFAGRFLAPGRHGLETRIPAADVQRALSELRSRASAGLVPVVDRAPLPEPVEESLVPYKVAHPSTALTTTDLDSLRDAMFAIVREDRESFLTTVQESLVSRDRELAALRGQIAGLQGAFDRLRKQLASPPPVPEISEETAGPAQPSPIADRRAFDVDAVLREIDEIEQLLVELQG